MSNENKNNYAVVEFQPDLYQPNKRLIEVICYSWLTEAGDQCFCPTRKNWSYELKNMGVPREDWILYSCRILKFNIGTIKAANIECTRRLNYTTSEMSEEEIPSRTENKLTTWDYNQIFDDITESKDESDSLDALPTPDKSTTDILKNAVSETDNIVYLQYNPSKEFQEIQKNIVELSIKSDQMQAEISTLVGQNKIIMQMMTEFFKRTSPLPSGFEPTINIDTKHKLDQLEAKLREEEFFRNMAYYYTKFAYKGDAKKEENGFVKSILTKLINENLTKMLRWDRVKNLEAREEDGIVTDFIFFKKYTKILELITEVCNKNKKETNMYYNKDNISQARRHKIISKEKIIKKNLN